MPAPRDPNLLLAAARAYYLEGKSQAEIAVSLETSRSNVSRMLTEAQRQGIVEIKIHDPSGRVRELELALRKKFGLKDVLVAASRGGSANRLAAQVGVLGAQLLTELLPQADTIAMSWGHSLQHVVYGIETIDTTNTEVVQLVGGMAAISNEISGHELVRELASRVGAAYRFMHAPATFSSKQARDTMAGEPSVVESLAAARAADLAFVGIGSPAHGSSAALLASMDLSPEEEKEFWAAVPTGDVAARYFNSSGQAIHGAVEDHVLAISLADLIAIPNVVGVATGRAKANALLGAMRGQIIDSLVCDESLARAVLTNSEADS